ncbi:hypothetical protein F4825DRAFT_151551 [Nemania diffusa]|nr:hypothetical protein F4825DRAFT_151551 [Nemania diffusa]
MADKPKSSMLDSVDDEKLSKPTPNLLAGGYCATVISNLEGWRGGVLPCTRESRQPTIEHLDLRVRRLENTAGINSPPPMDTPSWESLTWRVTRLHRKMPSGPQILSYWLTASPPLMNATVSLLQSTVASIGGWGLRSWAAFVEGEPDLAGDDFVQAAAQFLCYLAGRRSYKVHGCFNLVANCRLALDLSLDADANPSFYLPGPMLRTGLGANMISRVAGRCTCACHGGLPAPGPPPPPPRVVNVHNPRRKQKRRHVGVKARIARVFGKLACWKRNRGEDIDSDSDASSISTSSSSSTAV